MQKSPCGSGLLALAAIVLSTFSFTAQARDTKLLMSLEDALESPAFEGRLNAGIKFYFGDQSFPEATRKQGEYITNKKTNAFGKSDLEACQWVLLSALISLQDRAVSLGGNAVVNIRSYYDKNAFSSTSEYECHAGGIMAGVALIGDVATLPE